MHYRHYLHRVLDIWPGVEWLHVFSTELDSQLLDRSIDLLRVEDGVLGRTFQSPAVLRFLGRVDRDFKVSLQVRSIHHRPTFFLLVIV